MHRKILKISLLASVLLLSACSLPKQIDETRNWSANRLYSEAKDDMDSGDYDKAISMYQKLEARYPFGTYAQQAQMEIAYAYYREGEQKDALAAVDRFIKLHPDHPNVDYMYYLRGLINFNDQISIFDFLAHQDPSERDPRAARDAFDSFKLLVDKFPHSKYADDSRARMAYLINALAEYDVHVANYYYRRGAYLAAANRAQDAIKEYQGAPAIEEALYVLVKSYDALGLTKLSDDADRVLKTNYPNSVYLRGGPKKKEKPWWQIW